VRGMAVASFPGPSKTITIEPIELPAEDVPDPVQPPDPVEPPAEAPEPEPEKTPARR
jgi:hypothetical protein